MGQFTTDRAVKKAYIAEVGGARVLPFQFAPHELNFSEGGTFQDIVKTGQFITDLMWISGKAQKFTLNMFIDRTEESLTADNYDQDPFSNLRRFPNANPRYTVNDAMGLAMGIFKTDFNRRGTAGMGNTVQPSIYSASPDFSQASQASMGRAVGVYADLERILYFVRPQGFQQATATIDKMGRVSVTDYAMSRFTPPPICRFFYGAMWREGYIIDVDYKLSVMNKQLIPQRIEATIQFAQIRWGYLNDLSETQDNDSVIDADLAITKPVQSNVG